MIISSGWIEGQTEKALRFKIPKNDITNLEYFWFPKSCCDVFPSERKVSVCFWSGWRLENDITSKDLQKLYDDADQPSDDLACSMAVYADRGKDYIIEEFPKRRKVKICKVPNSLKI